MAWNNGDLVVYHGTDMASLPNLQAGIRLSHCKPMTDFGQGFYTTTNLHQARQWANLRARRIRPRQPTPVALVVEYRIARPALAALRHLAFITEGRDYFDLINYARGQGTPLHACAPAGYEVVYGPVSLWPQTMVIKDCDQISFHSPAACGILQGPTVVQQGNPFF